MKELTVRTGCRPLGGGRSVRAGLYVDGDEPRLLVLACGFVEGGAHDLVDPEHRDRLVLPGHALGLLRELLSELDADG